MGQSEMSKEMALGEIQVTEKDVQKQMEGLDIRKAPGPDSVRMDTKRVQSALDVSGSQHY